jgi:hypothetical protein
MKPVHALAILAFVAAKKLMSGTTITWSEINAWIKQNGNPDLIGVGYSGNSLSRAGATGYADVRQEQSGGKVIVSVSVVFDVKQGAAANKSWTGTKLDGQLKKRFGDNLRFRIQV